MKTLFFFPIFLGALVCSAPGQVATLESLTRDLAHADHAVRLRACDALGRMGEKAFPATMALGARLLEDESPGVRQMAAQALGEIGRLTREAPGENDEVLVRLLAKALGDPEADVRLIAAQALGNFQKRADAATMALVFVVNNDGSPKVRHTAIATLGQIGRFKGPESGKAVPHLAKALNDADPEIRRLAAYVLGLFGEAGLPALPKLMESLRDGPPQAQMEAARTLGGYGPSAITACPLLLEKVRQNKYLELSAVAAKAVVRIDPSRFNEVVAILEQATQSKDAGIRLFALEALLEIDQNRTRIEPTLKRMQSDEIVDIQLMVARAMEDSREGETPAQTVPPAPPQQGEKSNEAPKVILGDATEEDAAAALAKLKEFLHHWQKQEYAKAELMVDERLRHGWRQRMEQRPMVLLSIDDIRVFRHKETLRARVQLTAMPKQGHGLDMIFRDGKWWISGD